ncbi:hypothetical protein PB1_10634 [Bacillus methanolicus PB1]|uniref:Uncharacterized protein n=1 Tax=Bacillus methanolicus PB1 TaxID=997296 RepID=I3DUU6_BACMT|nr:hypothetical protein PB1_10634 [Bacillus methanolicus PB1]
MFYTFSQKYLFKNRINKSYHPEALMKKKVIFILIFIIIFLGIYLIFNPMGVFDLITK